MLIQENFEKFNTRLRELSRRDQVNEDFHEQSQELYKKIVDNFKDMSQSLIMEGSRWEEQVLIHDREIE